MQKSKLTMIGKGGEEREIMMKKAAKKATESTLSPARAHPMALKTPCPAIHFHKNSPSKSPQSLSGMRALLLIHLKHRLKFKLGLPPKPRLSSPFHTVLCYSVGVSVYRNSAPSGQRYAPTPINRHSSPVSGFQNVRLGALSFHNKGVLHCNQIQIMT